MNKLDKKSKKNIKITVGKHSGFCFGVKRAYRMADQKAKNSKKIFILGKLVHNNDVCDDLKRKGIKEIKSLGEVKKGSIIFTAHGVGPKLYEEAKTQGIKIIDTTCPKVIKVQRLAKNYAEKGWQVIIFGDEDHKEVKGIKEWSNNTGIIIGSLREAKKIKLDKKKRYCLIAQTTQNAKEFYGIKKYLAGQLPNFTYFNTICDSTDSRQSEIRKLAKDNDVVIVIGGKESANSKRLWEIAKKINSKTFFIQNEKELREDLLKDVKSVAISAGASTPGWAIKKVVDRIKNS